jgi:GGDEF domain-containing protein
MGILAKLLTPICHYCQRHGLVEIPDDSGSPRDKETGLYNNAFFKERLHQEKARTDRYKSPLTMLMLALDSAPLATVPVKQLPRLRQALANLLLNQLRSVDIISRYGENTFAILLPETKLLHARFVAERLRLSVLEKDFAEKDTDVLKITASLAVGQLLNKESDVVFIARVSAALESSQAENGNRVALASDFNGEGKEFERE